MVDDSPEYKFLYRAYTVVKAIAVTSVAIAGVLVSVIALDIKISPIWQNIRLPLYWVALFGSLSIIILLLLIVGLSLLLRSALSKLSYFESKSKALVAAVSRLEDMANVDPITGIQNSKGLELELQLWEKNTSLSRCLILIDLKNFGEINKKYNHWKGDEYLRNFAARVTATTRRDEYLYKKRELERGDPSNPRLERVMHFCERLKRA